ncbi:hypothetical protein A2V68_01175 [candidate division Kazan bacterium RBG_13_50_9]|uniref:Bacterial Ig-like domain-containing protein n=1 Tax=candidate division Kazan bacterium RBG_13_50_9 TaxID=1798535 RepID=A0A1F4NST1_UNCK3|nr:MAG: hypothetical protein A2V68_01175 [candidate division Kazan bacterium RBG_13_50_9]
MKDDQDKELGPQSFASPPVLALAIALLLVIVGTVSFFYAGGWQTLKHSWTGWFAPSISLAVEPESTGLPADGTSSLSINIIATNRQGQLLDGEDITVELTRGTAGLTNSARTPSGASKQVILQAPSDPQTLSLAIGLSGIIKNLDIEAFDPTPPAVPSLKAPTDGSVLATGTPTISGQAAPNTQTEIYLDDILNTTTMADQSGLFNAPLEKAVGRGRHKLALSTVNRYGIRSASSAAIYIDIQTLDPEVDFDNIRLRPNPVPPGEVTYVFIPVSNNTKSVTVAIEGKDYPLYDRNDSSIFSGAVQAPLTPGLYRLSATIINESGNSVLVSNITSLRVQ